MNRQRKVKKLIWILSSVATVSVVVALIKQH